MAYDDHGAPTPVAPNPDLAVVIGISNKWGQAQSTASWLSGAAERNGPLWLNYHTGGLRLQIATLRNVIQYARGMR